jgi:hypothetical protein
VPDDRHGHAHDALGEAAGIHDLAGEEEERNRHQREGRRAVDQVLRDDLRVDDVELEHQRHGGQQDGEGDRYADEHAERERSEEYE